MPGQKRTRPRAASKRQEPEKVVLPKLNEPYAGCCKPYPDATFRHQTMVSLNAHHTGPNCNGYLEPMDVEAWNAEVDARAAARAIAEGNER